MKTASRIGTPSRTTPAQRPGRKGRGATLPSEPALEIVNYAVDKIERYANNPRINDDAIDAMVSAIKRYGFRVPIILQESERHLDRAKLIDGELRHKAVTKLGWKTIPATFVPPGSDEAFVRSFRISVNRMAELADWDEDKLALEIKDLGEDAKYIGFADEDLSGLLELVNGSKEEKEEKAARKTNISILDPDIIFEEKIGRFDLPQLRADKLLDMRAPHTWAGPGVTSGPPPYAYNFSCDSTIDIEWKKTVICFYTADHKFDIIWEQPDKKIGKFLEYGVKWAISPNWSVFGNWPVVQRAYNVFRSRWVARYMQEAGLLVVPDICGVVDDLDWLFDGLPGRSPLCIQLQGKYNKKELRDTARLLQAVFDFYPQRLWVYGVEARAKELFPMLRKSAGFPIEFIIPRLALRKKELEGF